MRRNRGPAHRHAPSIASGLPYPTEYAGKRWARPCQLVDDGAIIELIENAARLARAGKTGKTGATGTNAPGGHGDEKFRHLGGDGIDINVATAKLNAKRIVILRQRDNAFFVFSRDNTAAIFVSVISSSPELVPCMLSLSTLSPSIPALCRCPVDARLRGGISSFSPRTWLAGFRLKAGMTEIKRRQTPYRVKLCALPAST